MLTGRAWLLLSWIVVGAVWLTAHAVVVWQSLRASELPWKVRLIALVPPAAPWVAWRGGRRASPIVWAITGAIYLVLRALGL